MPITTLTAPPTTTDNSNFTIRGDNFLADLPVFVTEINTSVQNIVAQTALAQQASQQAASASSTTNSLKSTIESLYTQLNNRYLGNKANNPSTNNTGGALQQGCFYWNTTVLELRIWTGTTWQALQSNASNTYTASLLANISPYIQTTQSAWLTTANNADYIHSTYAGASSTAPGTPVPGTFYYNTVSNKVLLWSGTSWQEIVYQDSVSISGGTLTGTLTVPKITTSALTVNTSLDFDWYPPDTAVQVGELVSNTYVQDSYLNIGTITTPAATVALNFGQYSVISVTSNGNITITCTNIPPAGCEVVLIMKGRGITFPQAVAVGTGFKLTGGLTVQAPNLLNWTTNTFMSDGSSLVLTKAIGPMPA